MGIYAYGRNVDKVYYRGIPVLQIYARGQLVWPIKDDPIIDVIISCYYNGYWIDEHPWTDDTPWTD